MNLELKQILFRVVPFLLIIIGISIALNRKKITKADLFLQKPATFKSFFLWWFGFLLFIILTEIVLDHLGLLKVSEWNNSIIISVIKIFGIVVLAPVAEELVFRGLLLSKLAKKVNKHLAILLQALFFVVLHSFDFDNSWHAYIGMGQVFIDAVLFAYAMYATKSIYTPMAMHATGNAIAVLEQFLL